jgi:hypothetical protein
LVGKTIGEIRWDPAYALLAVAMRAGISKAIAPSVTTAAPCTPCRFGEIQHLTNDSRDRVIIFQ